MTITIDEKAQVKVSVPFFLEERRIHDFIHEKAHWIGKKLGEIKQNKERLSRRYFDTGHKFLFLGKKYEVNIIENHSPSASVIFDGSKWSIHIPPGLSHETRAQCIRDEFIGWYRAQAQEFLATRVFHFSRIMQVSPQKITVRTQKRIWGSCHPRAKTIHLNWQIIMAPLEVIDYVIVHELCHLTVPNHSKRFWRKVEKILPDFKERKRWFKVHAIDMTLPQ